VRRDKLLVTQQTMLLVTAEGAACTAWHCRSFRDVSVWHIKWMLLDKEVCYGLGLPRRKGALAVASQGDARLEDGRVLVTDQVAVVAREALSVPHMLHPSGARVSISPTQALDSTP
jgi:hypothetical protein